MIRTLLMIIAIVTLSGCAGICNPNAAGVAAGMGFNKGSLGIPGIALAGAEIGACGAYRIISELSNGGNKSE